MRMISWENVYVFISSTFNDMHAERDYLVKKVFPELSEWCAQRRLRLIDIDLRWGVTEEDSQENKRVVDVCLSGIDRCRPLFLCFLGQRRGWIPGENDIAETTFANFPKLKQYLGSSVTEMEIIHAIIDPMLNGSVLELKNQEQACFFVRDDSYLSEIKDQNVRNIYTNEGETDPAAADESLQSFVGRVRQTGRPVHDYSAVWDPAAYTPELLSPGKDESIADGRLTGFSSDGKPLSEIVIEELKQAITQMYPDREPAGQSTPLQKELDEQAKFLQAAQEGYIERTGDYEEIIKYLADDDRRPMAVCADAGMGKTSYLARLAEKQLTNEEIEIVYRFVGTSENSVSVNNLLVFLAQELQNRFSLENVPDTAKKIRDNLYLILASCAKKKPLILIIDAVNQLDSGLSDLTWIPEILPERVKLIYSFKLGDPQGDALYEALCKDNGARIHLLRGFEDIRVRAEIVDQYLSQYLKKLDAREMETIISMEGASNPLYLKILLSELKVFGSFEGLHDLIVSQFGNTAMEAFEGLLERIETDPGYSSVAPKDLAVNVFGWLSHSKNGLETDELAELLVDHHFAEKIEDARDSVNLVLRQLRPYLAKRDKRQDFFYESFMLAAKSRYCQPENGGKPAQAWHKDLADYFRKRNFANVRKLSEQAYQAAYAGMRTYLKSLLTNYNYIERRVLHTGLPALLADYELADLAEANIASEDRSQLALIREALEQSAPVISLGISQIATQLFGRLSGFDLPLVKELLSGTKAYKEKYKVPWLRPLCSYLPQPGSRIERYFKTMPNQGARIYQDRKRMLVYIPSEQAVQLIEIRTGRVLRSYPLEAEPAWICLVEEQNVLVVRETYKMYFLDLTTGSTWPAEEIKTFYNHQFSVADDMIVHTASGKRFERIVYVTQISTGKLLYSATYSMQENRGEYYSVFYFDPVSGNLLQSVEDQGFLIRDPARDFKEIGWYRNLPEDIRPKDSHGHKVLMPDHTPFIITLTEFDGLTVYDRETRTVLMHQIVAGASFAQIAVSPDGKLLFYASLNSIYIYSLETFKRVNDDHYNAGINTNSITGIAISEDGLYLYTGRKSGLIEVYDIRSGEKIREYAESRSEVRNLYLVGDGSRMVSFNLSEVLIWNLDKEVIDSDPGLSDLQITSLALAPNGQFLIVTTNHSDGSIYRIDIPSMECRKLVEKTNTYHLPDEAIINSDSTAFAVRIRLKQMLFYDCETGAPLGECNAVDSDDTGIEEAMNIWDPVFLPKDTGIGDSGLTILYRQHGNIVIQDPYEPEKTKILRAFELSIEDKKLFDDGKKLALYSGKSRHLGNGRYENMPDRDDGAKIYDLATLECVMETKDRFKVFLEAYEIKDRPAFVEYARNKFAKHKSARVVPEEICRTEDTILYTMYQSTRPNSYAIYKSTSSKALIVYVNEGKMALAKSLYTSDGKYHFLRFGTMLCPFCFENGIDV